MNDNKLIAEFMGLEYFPKAFTSNNNVYGGFEDWQEMEDVYVLNPTEEFRKHLILNHPEEVGLDHDFKLVENHWYSLRYDTSWDWLMSVVEKIEELEIVHWFTIMRTYAGISIMESPKQVTYLIDSSKEVTESMGIPDRPNATKTYTKQMDSKIEAVYYCVIEFIKWYNGRK